MYNKSIFTMMDEIFESSARTPVHNKAELRTTETGYIAEILLPGFKKEEVTVEIKNSDVIIEALTERNLPSYLNRRVRRVYTLENIDSDSVEASLENGLLTLVISSAKKKAGTQIVVK